MIRWTGSVGQNLFSGISSWGRKVGRRLELLTLADRSGHTGDWGMLYRSAPHTIMDTVMAGNRKQP